MRHEKIIDLKQQLIDLFDREEILAFFDFQLAIRSNENIQGLCKISEPKKGQAASYYLSLLFIIDTTDDAIEGLVDAHIKATSWVDFKHFVKGVNMVVPLPHVRNETRHCLKEVEIYFDGNTRITRPYIAHELYPAILRVFRCIGGELVFWEELSSEKKQLKIDPGHHEGNRSLIDMVVDYFKGE
ncbi:MAG: hypothetical protein CSYNP_00064 [Syntrophus sp. SKADARSKE-3]|nr:hypothetical protein [Syntrophus sp. SKADARSKE-3]